MNISSWLPAKYVFYLDAYSEPCQISKMKLFRICENREGLWVVIFFLAKSSILDLWQGSKYASETSLNLLLD